MMEKEFKGEVLDVPELVRRLEELGLAVAAECIEIDTYYSHPCRNFSKTDEALRIRERKCDEDVHYVITYKGRRFYEGDFKVRKEIEAPLVREAVELIKELLKELGFTPLAIVQKRRTILRREGVEVTVDELPGIGTFVEVELAGKSQRSAVEVVERLRDVVKPVSKTYLEICLERGSCGSP